ncbi:patatin-like phospholipase family protein [Clostridium sp. 'White wine YQ']|uniref:patatin-like phospholipase family protein n=1 Tax=Clostridium sp. 'White wine YQ' TaxID=3027474 RepID=UPI002365DBFD|nr:patatin-like phospholipase family protein [Clostridium sp. 'White wine YQ']MDD7795524.1 patatin-like phospholipase family protein [Clostridium sp. 'White wine YQ']
MENTKKETRAVVLGGGGVTGMAWEIGIITALLEKDIDLSEADVIIGTSAGSFVGSSLASGYDMRKLYDSQFAQNISEVNTSVSPEIMGLWAEAFRSGKDDTKKIGKLFGDIAKKYPPYISKETRQRVVESRLTSTRWPQKLKVTAVDADTGELHVFDGYSGTTLLDAVNASGAVPGIWPLVSFNEKYWIDGGMVSSTNARLADGYDKIVILSPMPQKYGLVPSVKEDASEMQKNSKVSLIIPNEDSILAIGKNPYDPNHAASSAKAGFNQGIKEAADIYKTWL